MQRQSGGGAEQYKVNLKGATQCNIRLIAREDPCTRGCMENVLNVTRWNLKVCYVIVALFSPNVYSARWLKHRRSTFWGYWLFFAVGLSKPPRTLKKIYIYFFNYTNFYFYMYIYTYICKDLLVQEKFLWHNCGHYMSPLPLHLVSIGMTESMGSSLRSNLQRADCWALNQ